MRNASTKWVTKNLDSLKAEGIESDLKSSSSIDIDENFSFSETNYIGGTYSSNSNSDIDSDSISIDADERVRGDIDKDGYCNMHLNNDTSNTKDIYNGNIKNSNANNHDNKINQRDCIAIDDTTIWHDVSCEHSSCTQTKDMDRHISLNNSDLNESIRTSKSSIDHTVDPYCDRDNVLEYTGTYVDVGLDGEVIKVRVCAECGGCIDDSESDSYTKKQAEAKARIGIGIGTGTGLEPSRKGILLKKGGTGFDDTVFYQENYDYTIRYNQCL